MRISEAMGLTWEDIDLKTGKITVVRQRIKDYFETPKTESSARTFYADAALLAYLRSLKAAQAKDEMRLGEAYQATYEDKAHNRAVVVLPKKLPPAPTLERRMLLSVKENGVPFVQGSFMEVLRKHGFNAHSFRHTHATQLIEAGAKPVDVAARLGHKNATITQNLYTHDTEEMQQETARIFSELVGK